MLHSKLLWSVLSVTLFLTGLVGCGGGGGGTANTSGTANTTGNATGGASATLSWNAPTTYTDGSSLDPFSTPLKYRIYYGTSSGTYTEAVDVKNPTTTVDAASPETTTITSTVSLAPGTYYFVVAAIDTSGQESNYSNEASKTL